MPNVHWLGDVRRTEVDHDLFRGFGSGDAEAFVRRIGVALDAESTDAAMTAEVGPLWQKIAIWRPAAIVFIYKRAASISAGRDLGESWGHLPGVALAGRPCVLMPSPYAPVEQVDEGLNFVRNLVAALPIDRG
jgi:hypothetical protein